MVVQDISNGLRTGFRGVENGAVANKIGLPEHYYEINLGNTFIVRGGLTNGQNKGKPVIIVVLVQNQDDLEVNTDKKAEILILIYCVNLYNKMA